MYDGDEAVVDGSDLVVVGDEHGDVVDKGILEVLLIELYGVVDVGVADVGDVKYVCAADVEGDEVAAVATIGAEAVDGVAGGGVADEHGGIVEPGLCEAIVNKACYVADGDGADGCGERGLVDIVIAGGALAVGAEEEGAAIEGDALALFVESGVDRVAEVGGGGPCGVAGAVAHKEIGAAHAGPAVGGEVEGAVVEVDVGCGLVAGGVDRRAGIDGLAPNAIFEAGYPDIVTAVAALAVADEEEFAIVGGEGGHALVSGRIDGRAEGLGDGPVGVFSHTIRHIEIAAAFCPAVVGAVVATGEEHIVAIGRDELCLLVVGGVGEITHVQRTEPAAAGVGLGIIEIIVHIVDPAGEVEGAGVGCHGWEELGGRAVDAHAEVGGCG